MSEPHAGRPGPGPVSRLGLTRAATASAMAFERLWPLALPLLILFAIFAILSWFGLFRVMPEWLRVSSLTAFAIAAAGALLLPLRFRRPEPREVDRRIETDNRLEHEPIGIQSDRIAAGDAFAEALWHEHRRRMAERLDGLEASLPRTSVPSRDPWALRAVVALLFVIALAYSTGPFGGGLGDAFVAHRGAGRLPSRIDAWVTPPAYTGRAPVYLSGAAGNADRDFAVPEGSRLTIHVIGGSGAEQLQERGGDGKTTLIPPKQAAETESADPGSQEQRTVDFEVPLKTDSAFAVADSGRSLGQWTFTVTPDRPPTIAFAGEPTHALNGALQLAYRAEDDYGVTAAHAEIVPVKSPGPDAHPLFEAPKVPLALPRHDEGDVTKTEVDLTGHPWAGSEVRITLVASDAAGHVARSETKTIKLPERPFTNPLARAVVEQRRILALDADSQDRVLDMLDAVTIRPRETIRNLGQFLALRSARSRLALAGDDGELRDVVAYMWDIARGIEDGNLSSAEQRLRQAQDALRQALKGGASDKDIQRLTQALRDAINNYLKEFAERARKNPDLAQTMPNLNGRELSRNDIGRMLDQIENLAKQGARDQAQQLLSQLQNMFNNLQMGQNGQRGQQGQMQKQLNALGDLMRRQQELMNKTFRLDRQNGQNDGDGMQQEGQQGNQQGRPQEGDQMTDEQLKQALGQLQEGQGQLRSDLGRLMDGLKGLGMKPGNEFGEAGQAMGRAGNDLGKGDSGNAVGEQGTALDALRRGARGMMQQMQQAMGEQGKDGFGQRDGEGLDPLGRPRATSGPDLGGSVKVPDQIDIQRAREILDAIRRRLGDAMSPQMERDYLERLLNFDSK
jgi:uncharacterized protein (TIGR02302 family)